MARRRSCDISRDWRAAKERRRATWARSRARDLWASARSSARISAAVRLSRLAILRRRFCRAWRRALASSGCSASLLRRRRVADPRSTAPAGVRACEMSEAKADTWFPVVAIVPRAGSDVEPLRGCCGYREARRGMCRPGRRKSLRGCSSGGDAGEVVDGLARFGQVRLQDRVLNFEFPDDGTKAGDFQVLCG